MPITDPEIIPVCEQCGQPTDEQDGQQCRDCENEALLANPPDHCVVIEVEGGIVQEVHNLPDGWDYAVADHD